MPMPVSTAGSPARLPRRRAAIGNHLRPRSETVTAPDPEVLEKAAKQAEFTAPAWDYFDNRVQEKSISTGREMARKYKSWLDRIEARFGVDRNILLAIWSMNSN